jgi:hypothetical protein
VIWKARLHGNSDSPLGRVVEFFGMALRWLASAFSSALDSDFGPYVVNTPRCMAGLLT